MKKLFLAKGQKINELPYELHHVFAMMIAYTHKKQPNTITALRNTDKLALSGATPSKFLQDLVNFGPF